MLLLKFKLTVSFPTFRFTISIFRVTVEPQFTKCQGTREIGSLYQGSVTYILKGRAGEYCLSYRVLRCIEVRLIEVPL